QSPVAGPRLRCSRIRARPRGPRPREPAAHTGPGILMPPFRRVSTRGRANQYVERRSPWRHRQPAGACRHGLSRIPERRRRILDERNRLVRQSFVQQLRQQRLADYRERAAPILLRRSAAAADRHNAGSQNRERQEIGRGPGAAMSAVQDEFFRRYATSPMHVPRLERLLAAYGAGEPDVFAATFIGWDRECSDAEAARIVTELLAVFVDENGTLVRLSDDAVRG